MPKELANEMNVQINKEIYSAYLYWAMSAYCESLNLKGAANWFQSQAGEEMVHAMKFYHFLLERGEEVELLQIDQPEKEWKNLLAVFEQAYEHEQFVTSRINLLVKMARENDDYASENFLQWFIAEQVEEEASALEIVQKLKLVGDHPQGLFMIDAELAKRPASVTFPASAAE